MGFPKIKLVEIVNVKGGKRLPKGENFVDETTIHPYIRARDIRDGKITFDQPVYISSETHSKIARYVTGTADVCITIVGANVGDVGQVPRFLDGANLTENAVKLKGKSEGYIPGYLKYALLTDDAQKQMKNFAAGTAQPKLGIYKINEVEVPYPQYQFRKKIAELLEIYDNLIENNSRRIAILEDMAQSLYREWFVKFRFPGHENCQFKDSSLGNIPAGWEVIALENISERITDGAHKSPKSVEFGVPMASVKDMHDFGFNLDKCRQISEEDYLELERQDSVVKANDVLVAKDGSYLKHTFVVEKDLKVALLSSIAMIRPNDKVKPHWLAYCLRSDIVKERMKQCVSGVAIPRIILKDFRKFKIFLPSEGLLNNWNELVRPMVEQCWNLHERNKNLKAQRDTLLPKLISGKIELRN